MICEEQEQIQRGLEPPELSADLGSSSDTITEDARPHGAGRKGRGCFRLLPPKPSPPVTCWAVPQAGKPVGQLTDPHNSPLVNLQPN